MTTAYPMAMMARSTAKATPWQFAHALKIRTPRTDCMLGMSAVGKKLIAGSRVTALIMIIGLPWPMGCSGSGSSGVSPAYRARIAEFKTLYGKDDAWESWMLANASRYETTFAISSTKPPVLDISFRYETTPIAYNPPWTNETEHMTALTVMAEGAYVGYSFNFVVNGDTNTSFANVIAGISQPTSYSLGKDVFLFFETIFNHEFGHRMGLLHHYDDVSQIGDGMHMPPGETTCIMDRNSTMFCSACRTALGVPLDVTDTTAMDMAMNDILSRYP